MRILLEGQVKGGKNHIQITQKGRRYPLPAFAAWVKEMQLQIWGQIGFPNEIVAYDEPLSMVLDYWPGDKRTRDIPAIVDAILHVLESAGVLTNDKWVKSLVYTEHELDKDNPRVEMVIRPRGPWIRHVDFEPLDQSG